MGTKHTNSQTSGRKFKKPRGFRMAYSVNNHQPVLCTMISDQPFFYMDEEMLLDDDALLYEDSEMDNDFAEAAFGLEESFSHEAEESLSAELLKLKTKMDAYERVSLEFSKPADQRFQQFLIDSKTFSSKTVSLDTQKTLDIIKNKIAKSSYAQGLMDFAIKHNVEFVISNETQNVSYDKKGNKILIRGDIDGVDQVLLTVQELRRHWQHRQGALVHPLTFHPDQAVLINRAQFADLSVAVIRTAWEMKLQGDKDMWARIENSSLSDLGRALAREALSDFRTLNNGKASAAVFETWFLSERCRNQDKKLIQAMLADYRGYVFDNAEASRNISIELMAALGEQPLGKNYLAQYASMIMSDPIFTDVRDRSNANFLWFIKFERSFSETERELQSLGVSKNSGIDQRLNNDITEDTTHDSSFSAQDKAQLRHSIFGDNPNGHSNVIYLPFGCKNDTSSVTKEF